MNPNSATIIPTMHQETNMQGLKVDEFLIIGKNFILSFEMFYDDSFCF